MGPRPQRRPAEKIHEFDARMAKYRREVMVAEGRGSAGER